MQATDEKREYQQAGHPPECPEQGRIFFRIVMSGVREVTGESAVCTGVTLLAGFDHIVTVQMRLRIRDRQDVVSAVTVIALGGLCVSELRDFSMVGVEITLGNVFMAAAALVHDLELEAFRVGPPDRMCRVAVAADRERLVGVVDEGRMDTLFELFLDAEMAGPAGGADIIFVYGRQRIACRKSVVS